jgi:hypothetical protein
MTNSKKFTSLQQYINTFINNLLITGVYIENKRYYFNVKCFCFTEFDTRADNILNNKTKSCGCSRRKDRSKLSITDRLTNQSLYVYKLGAIYRNLKFELTNDEFKTLIFNNCYYCNNILKHDKIIGKNKYELYYNGIDRINNKEGYTISNSVSCCIICNIAKSDMTIEEFYNWINLIANKSGYKKCLI